MYNDTDALTFLSLTQIANSFQLYSFMTMKWHRRTYNSSAHRKAHFTHFFLEQTDCCCFFLLLNFISLFHIFVAEKHDERK